jgi:hypothetical protein
MRRATFRIDGVPPSLNTWRGGDWRRQHGLRDAARRAVREAVILARATGAWDGRPFAQARVTWVYHFTARTHRTDPTNRVPKFYEDALVAAGVLADDDFRHVELVLRRGANAPAAWTEVVVEEVEADAEDGAAR